MDVSDSDMKRDAKIESLKPSGSRLRLCLDIALLATLLLLIWPLTPWFSA